MPKSYWSAVLNNRIGRRRALATTGAATLGAAFLAACGGDDSGGDEEESKSLVQPPSDTLKQAKACQLMMWGAAWGADYPDGENFMQLLYGPNTGQSNNGCYESKARRNH